jgi:Asp-tRNA(Asn)/Glu-tRNA(Gln) amidotransferase C subunit
MVDILKLEKLSCLKLSKDVELNLEQSLDGVMIMMKSLESLDNPVLKSQEIIKTDLSLLQNCENLVNKNEKINGLNLEQGMFLAPKVIKK